MLLGMLKPLFHCSDRLRGCAAAWDQHIHQKKKRKSRKGNERDGSVGVFMKPVFPLLAWEGNMKGGMLGRVPVRICLVIDGMIGGRIRL